MQSVTDQCWDKQEGCAIICLCLQSVLVRGCTSIIVAQAAFESWICSAGSVHCLAYCFCWFEGRYVLTFSTQNRMLLKVWKTSGMHFKFLLIEKKMLTICWVICFQSSQTLYPAQKGWIPTLWQRHVQKQREDRMGIADYIIKSWSYCYKIYIFNI